MEVIIILVTIAVFTISLCGILGNGFNLKTVIALSDVKTTFSVLFILMMVSDIAQLVLGMGLQVYVLVLPTVTHLAVLPVLVGLASNISLMSAAGMAVDRCLTVKMLLTTSFWNSSLGRTIVTVVVILSSCAITPWTSHISSESRCQDRSHVTAIEVVNYLVTVTVMIVTVGTACHFSKLIVKRDKTVTPQQPDTNRPQIGKYVFHCCKAIRWVVLEEVLTRVCLCTAAFLTMIYKNECLSRVSCLWWYRLLQVVSTTMKPFILALASRPFRKAVMHACFQQTPYRSASIFYNSEDDTNYVTNPIQRLSSLPCTEDSVSTFAVTSVDSNHLACPALKEDMSNAPVTIFQRRRYSFKGSFESQKGTGMQENVSFKSPSSPSIMADVSSTFYNSAISSFKARHSLQEQDNVHYLTDVSGSRDEPFSGNVNCPFQLAIGKRRKSTISCPGVMPADSSTESTPKNAIQTKEKAQSFGEKTTNVHKVKVNQFSYHLPPLIQKGYLHPGRKDQKQQLNDSNTFTCWNIHGSIESISTQCSVSLNTIGDIQESLSHTNSMCNLMRDTGSSLSLTSVNDNPGTTYESFQNMEKSSEASYALQNSNRRSVPDIVLMNDENVSTRICQNYPSESKYGNQVPLDAINNLAKTIPLNQSLSAKFEEQWHNGKQKNRCDRQSTEIEVGNWTEAKESQHFVLSSEGSRYSFQNSRQWKKVKQRRDWESLKADSDDGLKLTCTYMATNYPGIIPWKQSDNIKISEHPIDHPPEVKLAFCNLESSIEDGSMIQPSDYHSPTELSVDNPLDDNSPVTILTTSHVDSLYDVSPQSSTRKFNVSLYDPNSHVYLGLINCPENSN